MRLVVTPPRWLFFGPSQYDQFRDVLYSDRYARCPDSGELALPEGRGFVSGRYANTTRRCRRADADAAMAEGETALAKSRTKLPAMFGVSGLRMSCSSPT